MEKGNRIVIDTGVLVSAFAFGGTPKEAVRKAVQESIIVVSPPLLNEYREVPLLLERQKKISHLQLKALIAGISTFVSESLIVYPKVKLDLCRDKKDNMLLECCLEAKAELLITGDKDLLEIKDLPFLLGIVTPAVFFRRSNKS